MLQASDVLDEMARQWMLLYYWPYFVIGGHKDKFRELMLCRPK
jgi:hypothetical protein